MQCLGNWINIEGGETAFCSNFPYVGCFFNKFDEYSVCIILLWKSFS